MNPFRIALANIPYPANPEQSIAMAEQAIAQAAGQRAGILCFPECYVPGYRGLGKYVPPPDPVFLERAWNVIAAAAAKANLAVVLGTERIAAAVLRITALVINNDGTIAGFQDKVQLDPSEEGIYSPGSERRCFPHRHAHLWSCHLPRGLALSRNGSMGRPPRRTDRVPPASPRSRARRVPSRNVSPIQRIRSMRRRPCAAPRRTPVSSPQ